MMDDDVHGVDDGDDNDINEPRAHKKLLQAISSLGKVQHIQHTTRNEAERTPDEFNLIKSTYISEEKVGVPRRAQGVGINDIVRVLKDTGKHIRIGKNLKNVATTKKVLPVPLEKPAAERIKRSIGYENVKKKLARWDAIVTQNRAAESQIFPLPSETVHVDTAPHAKTAQMAFKSELMLEMEAAEAKLAALHRQRRGGDIRDPKVIEEERQRQLKIKLTQDQLTARRRELAYLKMRQSQQAAKARLQNNIKSKRYRKLVKRQKMAQQIKEFEQLQKTNPEAALEKLNMLEKNRVLERASLRHKNTGTWAKNLQIRAKYDKDVRKDLSDQLEISRQLTQKAQDSDAEVEEDDVEMKNDDKETISERDVFNPWMRVRKAKSKEAEIEEASNYRKYWLERNKHAQQLEEYKKLIENELQIIEGQNSNDGSNRDEDGHSVMEVLKKNDLKNETNRNKSVTVENGWVVEELAPTEHSNSSDINIDDIFDAGEDRQREILSKKLEKLVKVANRLKTKNVVNNKGKNQSNKNKEKDELRQLTDLSFKKSATKPILDEALNAEEYEEGTENDAKTKQINAEASQDKVCVPERNSVKDSTVDVIDPASIAPIKLKQTVSSLVGHEAADYDSDNDDDDAKNLDDQRMTIGEAFADDDVVAEFSKDKNEKSKPAEGEIQLSMPGWGSWAGAGISQEEETQKRNKRLIFKPPPEEKRRDENKNGIYINEEPSKSLRAHLVSDLPFPFTSLKDYEASIRAPLGRNYVPEIAFRLLTRPSVITRKGAVINPMDESELFRKPRKPRNEVERRIMETTK